MRSPEERVGLSPEAPFRFVHHFSGRHKFGLGEAVVQCARRRNLYADRISVDRDRGRQDLPHEQPYASRLALVADGAVDG
eukprot:4028229-Lingulodinium_polyedra.AAC.1